MLTRTRTPAPAHTRLHPILFFCFYGSIKLNQVYFPVPVYIYLCIYIWGAKTSFLLVAILFYILYLGLRSFFSVGFLVVKVNVCIHTLSTCLHSCINVSAYIYTVQTCIGIKRRLVHRHIYIVTYMFIFFSYVWWNFACVCIYMCVFVIYICTYLGVGRMYVYVYVYMYMYVYIYVYIYIYICICDHM